jgi:NodT family efflux transporter outer membrane factor (OMF) lipoprotein
MNNLHRLKTPFFSFVPALVILASCARTPVPELMDGDVPDNWQGPVDSTADVWPDVDWWKNFGSDELVEIIEEVKANNFDYQNNLRNLRAAQINLEEAGFQLWPTPSMSISNSASTSVARNSDPAIPDTSGGSSGPFNVSASVSFSGILSKPINYDRAINSYESQLVAVSETALNTLGTAASAYFRLLFLRDQIEATRFNLLVANEVLDITQARVDAGVEIPINLLNQRIQVANIENSLTSQLQQDFEARATLALLMGRSVQGFNIEGQTLEGIIVPNVQPGLPSELLTRSPQLVRAELSLQSAAINVDAARLNFFPQISLSGSAGERSSALIDLVSDPLSTTVSLSASISQTLLDNGGRRRSMEQAELNLESALANYRRTVIQTFNNVEIQLNNIELLKAQGEVQDSSYEAALEQYRLADLRYEQGTANYQTSLNAQNSLLSSSNSVLSNRLSQINAIISFYQTLGGGWEAGEILVEAPEYAQAEN